MNSQQQFDIIILLQEGRAISVGVLLYYLSLTEVVELVRFSKNRYISIKGLFGPEYSTFQYRGLVKVHSDQVLYRRPASITRDTGYRLYYPWPRVLETSRIGHLKKEYEKLLSRTIRTSSEGEWLITVQSELLLPLVDTLQEAQNKDPFVREEKQIEQ